MAMPPAPLRSGTRGLSRRPLDAINPEDVFGFRWHTLEPVRERARLELAPQARRPLGLAEPGWGTLAARHHVVGADALEDATRPIGGKCEDLVRRDDAVGQPMIRSGDRRMIRERQHEGTKIDLDGDDTWR